MHHLALLLFQHDARPEDIMPFIGVFIMFYLLFIAAVIAAFIFPLWRICKRTGFSPWLSLLGILGPLGVLVLLYVLAFADWKVAPVDQGMFVPPQTPYPPQYPAQYPPATQQYPPAQQQYPPAPPQDSTQQYPPQG